MNWFCKNNQYNKCYFDITFVTVSYYSLLVPHTRTYIYIKHVYILKIINFIQLLQYLSLSNVTQYKLLRKLNNATIGF